jgi:hypothetical protein
VATDVIPSGAIAQELAKEGSKKTISRDLGNGYSSLEGNDKRFSGAPLSLKCYQCVMCL